MQTDWAAENLQTIRVLMERATLYRRALAPVFLAAGLTGILAAGLGAWIHLESVRAFVLFWGATGVIALTEALLLVRRQAFAARETFWSPPIRRVAQALIPPFSAGLFFAVLAGWANGAAEFSTAILVCLWMVFFGCGLHAAGFFMPRGIKLFGCLFIISGFVLAALAVSLSTFSISLSNGVMGAFFGGAHVIYGIYLYLTERRQTAE
jgi:hypothetical protein